MDALYVVRTLGMDLIALWGRLRGFTLNDGQKSNVLNHNHFNTLWR